MTNSSKKFPANQAHNYPTDLKPPAKRIRRDCSDGDDSRRDDPRASDNTVAESCNNSHATLSSDALFVVMSFFHPRDLFNTAFACKTLRDTVTSKMVLQSSLIHGGHAKKTMEELHGLMSTHSMHVPSPIRMLRLACGKVCEFCHIDKVNHVRPSLGVFACWGCVTDKQRGCGLTKPWKRGWVRYCKNNENRIKYDAIFEHPRIAATANEYGMNYYVWSRRRSDRAGESVGPVVAWGDIDKMANHFSSANEMTNGGIDNYLTNNLNALSIDSYSEFNDTFTDMQQRAEAAMKEREENKRATKERTKENKIAKAEKMMVDLTDLIDEPFRDVALKRTKNVAFCDSKAKMSETPCICIATPFISRLLEPYIISPSKMKKKILRELAETINSKLRIITDKNLLAMDFFSDSDPLEAALKQHFREKLPNIEALFEEGKYYANQIVLNYICDEFLALLEADRLMGVMCHFMNNDLSPMLLAVDPSATLARSATNYEDLTVKMLAKFSWSKCLGNEDEASDLCFGRAFKASQDMFGNVLNALDEYSTWMLNKYEPEAKQMFQLDKMVRSSRYLEYLMEKDFDKLDSWLQREW